MNVDRSTGMGDAWADAGDVFAGIFGFTQGETDYQKQLSFTLRGLLIAAGVVATPYLVMKLTAGRDRVNDTRKKEGLPPVSDEEIIRTAQRVQASVNSTGGATDDQVTDEVVRRLEAASAVEAAGGPRVVRPSGISLSDVSPFAWGTLAVVVGYFLLQRRR